MTYSKQIPKDARSPQIKDIFAGKKGKQVGWSGKSVRGFHGLDITKLMILCARLLFQYLSPPIAPPIADVNSNDEWGGTALSHAAYEGHEGIVEMLKGNGAT